MAALLGDWPSAPGTPSLDRARMHIIVDLRSDFWPDFRRASIFLMAAAATVGESTPACPALTPASQNPVAIARQCGMSMLAARLDEDGVMTFSDLKLLVCVVAYSRPAHSLTLTERGGAQGHEGGPSTARCSAPR